eukprot:scaffold229260_cov24-Tisochrysis_lutea.AAC.2
MRGGASAGLSGAMLTKHVSTGPTEATSIGSSSIAFTTATASGSISSRASSPCQAGRSRSGGGPSIASPVLGSSRTPSSSTP